LSSPKLTRNSKVKANKRIKVMSQYNCQSQNSQSDSNVNPGGKRAARAAAKTNTENAQPSKKVLKQTYSETDLAALRASTNNQAKSSRTDMSSDQNHRIEKKSKAPTTGI